jgi:hypothetical protein
MALATVGFCFEGNPENGGEGLLISLNRCQAFKVAQKAYRGKESVKVIKGDSLLTDCNVTGTDVGTPDKPKFALRALWEYGLLPFLDALVAPGGQCEGALVILQEDNAGCILTTLLPFALTPSKPFTLLTIALELELNQRPTQGRRLLLHLANRTIPYNERMDVGTAGTSRAVHHCARSAGISCHV